MKTPLKDYLTMIKELSTQVEVQKQFFPCLMYYEQGYVPIDDIRLGIEFKNSITNPTDLVSVLIDKQYYLPIKYMTESQRFEFQNSLDGCNVGHRRMQGYIQSISRTIIGTFLGGLIGFSASGFSVVGVLVGLLIGWVIGRILGRKVSQKIKVDREIDVYEARIRCLCSWAYIKGQKYKFNINVVRFIAEKLLLEIKPAIHLPSEYPQMKHLLSKMARILSQEHFQAAMELTLRITKQIVEELDYQQEHDAHMEVCLIKNIDNVLKPLHHLRCAYFQEELSKFLLQPSIHNLSTQCPDPQMSIPYIKMLTYKMNQKVAQQQDLQHYIATQNFRDLENIYLDITKCRDVAVNMNISAVDEQQDFGQVPQIIKQLQAHPNRVFLNQVNLQQQTPYQSMEEIHQILEPDYNNHKVMYPAHYSQETINKFELFQRYHSESTDNWDEVVRTERLVMFKTMKDGSDTVFIKGYGIVDFDLQTTIKLIYDAKIRIQWDTLLCDFKVVQQEFHDTDVVSYYVKTPTRLVTEREWLQRRVLREDFPQLGQVTLLFYSVNLMPQNANRIRAHTEISTMIFEPYERGTKISILSNNDIGGYIPKMIVNRASASGLVSWFRNLHKANKII